MSFKGKVLFIGIGFYDYDNAIIQQFKQFGYEVDFFCETPGGFKFRYYSRRGNTEKVKKIINQLSLNIAAKAGSGYSHVFIIKGAYITNEAITILKNKNQTAKWILYLWDSVERVPNITNTVFQFDEIYSFDRIDCNNNTFLKFNPLFYRDEYAQPGYEENESVDIYFLGWYHSDRLKLIKKIIAFCDKHGLKHHMILYTGFFSYLVQSVIGGELKKNKKLLVYKPVSASSNIKKIRNARCVLDIAHPLQSGLTMRTIELLGAQKKIITTNKDIVNYDFYNKSNVLILDRDNPVLTVGFFKTPYQQVNQEIVEWYSLANWLSRMIEN